MRALLTLALLLDASPPATALVVEYRFDRGARGFDLGEARLTAEGLDASKEPATLAGGGPAPRGSYSVEVVLRVQALRGWAPVVSRGEPDPAFRLYVGDGGLVMHVAASREGGRCYDGRAALISHARAMGPGAWTHLLVAVGAAGGRTTIYVDGVPRGSASLPDAVGGFRDRGGPLTIGALPGTVRLLRLYAGEIGPREAKRLAERR
jgi:hypothetical protein